MFVFITFWSNEKEFSYLKKLSVKLVSERDDVWKHWAEISQSNFNSLSNNRILLKEIGIWMCNSCYLNKLWLNSWIQIMIYKSNFEVRIYSKEENTDYCVSLS